MSIATDYAKKAGPCPVVRASADNPIFWKNVGYVVVAANGLPLLHIQAAQYLHAEDAITFAKDILRVFGEEA